MLERQKKGEDETFPSELEGGGADASEDREGRSGEVLDGELDVRVHSEDEVEGLELKRGAGESGELIPK